MNVFEGSRRIAKLTAAGIAGAVCLAACATATPPGQLTDTDFFIRTVTVQTTVSQSVSALYEGLRYCGPSSGGLVFVTHHGVPDCAPPRPDGTAVCDLYISSAHGGRSDFVLGRLDFVPTGQGTSVDLRVQAYVANKEAILNAWEKFIKGNAKDVCPPR